MSLTLYWPKGFVGLYICPNCLTKNSEFILIKNKGNYYINCCNCGALIDIHPDENLYIKRAKIFNDFSTYHTNYYTNFHDKFEKDIIHLLLAFREDIYILTESNQPVEKNNRIKTLKNDIMDLFEKQLVDNKYCIIITRQTMQKYFTNGQEGDEFYQYILSILDELELLFTDEYISNKENWLNYTKKPYNRETKKDNKYDELRELKKLLDDDIITSEEYEKKKKLLLGI